MANTVDDSTTGRHIPALDGLRGTAILMVLFLHLYWSNPNPEANILVRSISHLRTVCWVGVDLFFVLSGFLLTGILYDTLNSAHYFRNFYGRRSLRIFPLYYGFLLLVIAVSSIQGYHWSSGTCYYLTYTISLLRDGAGYTTAPWININHFWSLAVEEQFYLMWPLGIYWLRTKKRIAVAILAFSVITLLFRMYLVLSGYALHRPYSTYAWSPSRFDTLLMGGLLAIVLRSRLGSVVIRQSWAVFVTCSAVLAAYGLWHGDFDPLGDGVVGTIGLTLLAIAFSALIGATLSRGSLFSSFFANPVLRFFGRYSYGLYVYHYTLQSIVMPYTEASIRRFTHSKLLVVVLGGTTVLVTTLMLAIISFECFERPILTLKKYFHDDTATAKLRQDVAKAMIVQ